MRRLPLLLLFLCSCAMTPPPAILADPAPASVTLAASEDVVDEGALLLRSRAVEAEERAATPDSSPPYWSGEVSVDGAALLRSRAREVSLTGPETWPVRILSPCSSCYAGSASPRLPRLFWLTFVPALVLVVVVLLGGLGFLETVFPDRPRRRRR